MLRLFVSDVTDTGKGNVDVWNLFATVSKDGKNIKAWIKYLEVEEPEKKLVLK